MGSNIIRSPLIISFLIFKSEELHLSFRLVIQLLQAYISWSVEGDSQPEQQLKKQRNWYGEASAVFRFVKHRRLGDRQNSKPIGLSGRNSITPTGLSNNRRLCFVLLRMGVVRDPSRCARAQSQPCRGSVAASGRPLPVSSAPFRVVMESYHGQSKVESENLDISGKVY
ncbi:hypothetical protein TorRG33x02_013870 [Trema orientale]|uniref:Uncharacterized protein n=1 Tax=Trema orientale TaxID=63057 RepID=A0A2P5FX79_TREOI|nr:hypothetical protein TorRG33x02_013870 [Trema orientale]